MERDLQKKVKNINVNGAWLVVLSNLLIYFFCKVVNMKLSEAISIKLTKLCKEKNVTPNKLAAMSCLTQSTVQNLIAGTSNNPKLLTIIHICDGLNISLEEFFDDEIFEGIESEF